MTDKFTTPCQPEEIPNSCGNNNFAYFSCANVLIGGTEEVTGLNPIYRSFLGNDRPSAYSPGIYKNCVLNIQSECTDLNFFILTSSLSPISMKDFNNG
tara:strand:- start:1307 stop:1600 length:294 start_codon:yes stop_codon:yes gene_type:complete